MNFVTINTRNKRPKLTWMVIFQSFISGLLGGSLFSNLFFTSVTLISPIVVTAIYNLLPAMTFVIALSLRLETFSIKTLSGKAKAVGTLVCVGGAMILTLYKGSELHFWSTNINLLHHTHLQAPIIAHIMTSSSAKQASNKLYILGIILAFLSCITYSLWLILLAKISTNYPCPYSSSALMCVMGGLQSVIYALFFDRQEVQWRLGWDIRLFTAFYLGIMGSALPVIMMTWCSRKRGPLFVSVFNPLTLVFVGLGSSLLLNETLRLGSVVGAMVIICGLYIVLWGKALDLRLHNHHSKSNTKPLSSIEIINHSEVDTNQGPSTNGSPKK
ncbi:hypothetical protein Leryth_001550 [Lithospermum erythrorhizon]|nr:hypothetical protein Leryth_001550 [Lithospermum erythrorhizon]